MTKILPEIPASASIPGTAVDFPEPVGALRRTRAQFSLAIAARNASAISKIGKGTAKE